MVIDAYSLGELETYRCKQVSDLGGTQRPVPAGAELADRDWSHLGSDQTLDGVPHGLEHPAHNVVPTLMNGHLDHDPIGIRGPDGEGIDSGQPILEKYAIPEGLAHFSTKWPSYLSQVGLHYSISRMGQSLSKIAVVGEQQQAFGFHIQSADVKEAFRKVLEIVPHTGAVLWMIMHGRNHAAGLIESQIDLLASCGDPFAIYLDQLAFRIDSHAHFTHNFAVYAHTSSFDEGLADAATSDTGGGEDLLEADSFAHKCQP
jgi:hypothetical protein